MSNSISYTPTDLEAFVRQRAPEIARDIQAAAARARIEADLVAEVEDVLKKFEHSFDLDLRLERECALVTGRADAVYNRLVIEYEPPGSLRSNNSARTNQHAIQQVKHYFEGLAKRDRHKKERFAGVVLDGTYYIFIRFRDGHWSIDPPLPVTPHSTETFLRYLLSLSTELALTPENLVRDFGENTVVSRKAVSALYAALRTNSSPRVNILFQQWQRLFSEICGYEQGSAKLDVDSLARAYGVSAVTSPLPLSAGGEGKGAGGRGEVSPLHLFFAIHTYYAVFIKLLAVQVAHYYLMPKVGTGLAQVAAEDTPRLQAYLHKMERGGVFADFGIKNFLEGDFFGWYLDVWDEGVEAAVRRLIADLANYSLVTLDVDPEETRDLLKQLYQNLMPKKLRHDLGEYYTPDWLAERVLNQLSVDGDPTKRLLDPACGSGTFLVLTIKRIRQYADDKMLPPAQVLEQILQNVVGFDLNPLAVMAARTNYLLALGDLLPSRSGEVSIPVYLADSIMTPTAGDDLFTRHAYSFNTAVGRFSVPRSLVQARTIDQLADLLEECVGVQLPPEAFRARLLQTFPLDAKRDSAEVDVALQLYTRLLELDRQGINGIWARIIKNAFAPLFQGRFDCVAGNPPWVNWQSLPDDYRQDTKPLWVRHGLFPHGGMDTILGKSKKDISMLMTYVAMENYLKDKGRLGFVITQSVFKTAGAGQGFRRFRLGSGTPVAVQQVDDMADLKPFEGASNRTAIVVLQRGRETKYPVTYYHWYKPGGGSVIAEDLTLEEVTRARIAVVRELKARPVDTADITSPWITARQTVLTVLAKVLGGSDFQARSGVCTWLNGVYWLEVIGRRPDGLVVISNLADEGRQAVPSVQAAIEANHLYPLIRGRNVTRWQALPQAYVLIVQDPNKRRGYDEDWLSTHYPKTYAYLKQFETELRRRAGLRRYFRETDPFYSMFNVADYTFAAYKVCWAREDKELRVAVVDAANEEQTSPCKQAVPDQTVQFVPCEDRDQAHYLCAVLNCSVSDYVAQSYTTDITTRIMQAISVRAFDRRDSRHRELSALSQQAHAATAAGEDERVREIEVEIDRLAAQLWGLTDAELREIQDSLAELG